MADKLTPAQRSVNMAMIRSKGTKPEMLIRRLVHSMGYRYRLHRKDLPGKPDLVFVKRKKVIFVHGCFWHQHDRAECADSRVPKSNAAYWSAKLQRNVQRDRDHLSDLKAAGWSCLVIWDCDIQNQNKIKKRLHSFLSH